jgi:hypothetical protein
MLSIKCNGGFRRIPYTFYLHTITFSVSFVAFPRMHFVPSVPFVDSVETILYERCI